MPYHYDTAPPAAAVPGPNASTHRLRTEASLTRAANKPLCIDLDGTLIRTNSLVEGLLSLVSQPNGLAKLPRIIAGRAALKQQVGLHSSLKPETLPYNNELLAFLREQNASGRRIVLATATDARIAHSIADHVGLFDEVIASDGVRNLKGAAKARELVRRFGHKRFDYAGHSRADLAVWREGDGIILVNASPAVVSQARAIGPVVGEFNRPRAVVPTALRAMRPYQWVKNLLVFVPIIASRSFLDLPGLIGAICILPNVVMWCSSMGERNLSHLLLKRGGETVAMAQLVVTGLAETWRTIPSWSPTGGCAHQQPARAHRARDPAALTRRRGLP